jgi:hypothetical protein
MRLFLMDEIRSLKVTFSILKNAPQPLPEDEGQSANILK